MQAISEMKPSEFDITVLGEQSRAFVRFLNALPLKAILVKANGDVVYLNPPAEQLFKPLLENSHGLKWPDFKPEEQTAFWEMPSPQGETRYEFDNYPIILDSQKLNCLIPGGNQTWKNSHRSSGEVFSNLFEQTNDGIVICDHDLKLIEWNKGMERISGYSAGEVIGMPLGDFIKKFSINQEDPIQVSHIMGGSFSDLLQRMNDSRKLAEIELEIRDKFGKKHIAQYRMFPVFWDGNVFPGAVIRDITEIKMTEDSLRASEIRFRALVEAMGEGAIALDLDLNIVFSNPVANTMYGADPGYLLGKNVRNFIDKKYDQFLRLQSERILNGISSSYELELSDFRGNIHALRVTSSPWRGIDQEIKGSIIVFSDITEQKVEEERLRFTSTHDEITGLFNRNYYEEEKARLLAGRRYPVSAVIIDMDEFKKVNDTLGHGVGDMLLKEFGSISRRVFRGEDVVARIGGDEFAILLPETDRLTARAVVERLQEAVARHNAVNPELRILFSVGTGTANSPQELEDAIRRADNRMYREKKQKKKNDELI
jgi:diguanylate cyclase (GGDEF)-like protein/PAS domain S-box-containing protein